MPDDNSCMFTAVGGALRGLSPSGSAHHTPESLRRVVVDHIRADPVKFDAVRGIPKSWFEVARVYRTRLPDLIVRILIPATIPGVLTGLRIALTRAWIVLVAAEILAADSGIGQMMEMGRQLFQLDVVLGGVIVSGVIGFALDRGAREIERRATRWKTA